VHKKREKLWKEIKKDLTEPALLEMDGLRVTRQVDLSLSRMIDPVRFGDLFKYVVATIRRVSFVRI